MAELQDEFNRKIDYLRLSITDRCNMRCVYCMPPEGVPWKGRDEILTYEEIMLFAGAAVKAGIKKIRLTGGEPLVRRDVVRLVASLSALEGVESLSLTTNGLLLAEYAGRLKEAGLKRVNISIDSLDPEVYSKMTRGAKLEKAMEGVGTALKAGFDPVKINVVLLKGINDDVKPFVKLANDEPVHVRFIEHMTFGKEQGEDTQLTCTQIEQLVKGLGEVEESKGPEGWGPARYIRMKGAKGTIGFICPTSGHLCSTCNRLRLTPDGRLRTCLFSSEEKDVASLIRAGASEDDIIKFIRETLKSKPEKREIERDDVNRLMSQIGG